MVVGVSCCWFSCLCSLLFAFVFDEDVGGGGVVMVLFALVVVRVVVVDVR